MTDKITSLADVEEAIIQITKDGNLNPSMFRAWSQNMERIVSRHARRAGSKEDRRAKAGKGTKEQGSKSSKSSADKGKKDQTHKANLPESTKDALKKGGLIKLVTHFGQTIPAEVQKGRWNPDYLHWLNSQKEGDGFYAKIRHALSSPVDPTKEEESKEDFDLARFKRKKNITLALTQAKLDDGQYQASRAYFPVLSEKPKREKASE